MKILARLFSVLIIAAILAGHAAAQDQPGLSEQQRLNERFDETKLPRAAFDEDSDLQGLALTREEAEAHRFTLKQVRFSGMTIYSANDMRPFFADMVGREISLAEILDVAEAIEEKYDADGLTPAEVALRRMSTADGTATLDVLEKY
jgi:hemolysin activation/secretion protein